MGSAGAVITEEFLDILEQHVLPRLSAMDLGRLASTSRILASALRGCPDKLWEAAAKELLPPQHPVNVRQMGSAPCRAALQSAHTAASNIKAGNPPKITQHNTEGSLSDGLRSQDEQVSVVVGDQHLLVKLGDGDFQETGITCGPCKLRWISPVLARPQKLPAGWHLTMLKEPCEIQHVWFSMTNDKLCWELSETLQCASDASGPHLSPDGSKLAYRAMRVDTDEPEGDRHLQIHILDVFSQTTAGFEPPRCQATWLSWLCDSSAVLVVTAGSEWDVWDMHGPGSICMVSTTGQLLWMAANPHRMETLGPVSSDGLYALMRCRHVDDGIPCTSVSILSLTDAHAHLGQQVLVDTSATRGMKRVGWAFSPDSRRFATSASYRMSHQHATCSVKVFDADTGKRLQRFNLAECEDLSVPLGRRGWEQGPISLEWSPCSRFLAVNLDSYVVSIWDVQTGAMVANTSAWLTQAELGKYCKIRKCCFSPDGTKLMCSVVYRSTLDDRATVADRQSRYRLWELDFSQPVP